MLDVFHEEGREDIRFIVMPFLRPAHEPPLQTVGDAVDFVSQILDVGTWCFIAKSSTELLRTQGLAFLHSKQYLTKYVFSLYAGFTISWNVYRHGDILMDASSLFPHGFHPIKLDLDPTARFPVKRRARSEVHVKYYFTNPVAEYAQYPYHSGSLALPPELLEPTELSRRSYYKIDIWYVGQVLKTQLLDVSGGVILCLLAPHISQVYSNIDFLQWTVGIMTDREPDFRLPAVDCREMWQGSIPRDLTTVGLARRLRFRQETWLQSMALDVIAMLGVAARFVEKFLIWLNNMHG